MFLGTEGTADETTEESEETGVTGIEIFSAWKVKGRHVQLEGHYYTIYTSPRCTYVLYELQFIGKRFCQPFIILDHMMIEVSKSMLFVVKKKK